MKTQQELAVIADELVSACKAARASGDNFVAEAQPVGRVIAKGRLLVHKLGSFGRIWSEVFVEKDCTLHTKIDYMEGVASEMRDAIQKGRLSTIEEIVSAEVLGDLVEQAAELLAKNYFLAACVVLRASLEERLKRLCERDSCLPGKTRPTIDDYNQALYAANKEDAQKGYPKLTMLEVTALAAIGNNAAHNAGPIQKSDAERMYSGLCQFLEKHSP